MQDVIYNAPRMRVVLLQWPILREKTCTSEADGSFNQRRWMITLPLYAYKVDRIWRPAPPDHRFGVCFLHKQVDFRSTLYYRSNGVLNGSETSNLLECRERYIDMKRKYIAKWKRDILSFVSFESLPSLFSGHLLLAIVHRNQPVSTMHFLHLLTPTLIFLAVGTANPVKRTQTVFFEFYRAFDGGNLPRVRIQSCQSQTSGPECYTRRLAGRWSISGETAY